MFIAFLEAMHISALDLIVFTVGLFWASTLSIASADVPPKIQGCVLLQQPLLCDSPPVSTITSDPKIQFHTQDNRYLSVLWWNIQNGMTSQLAYKKWGIDPLATNLKVLLTSNDSPDVIILAEVSQKLFEELLKMPGIVYEYTLFTRYSDKLSRSGMMLLSKFPLSDKEVLPLYGTPRFKDDNRERAYRAKWKSIPKYVSDFDRSAVRVTIVKNAYQHQVVFTHLINAWPSMSTLLKGRKADLFFRMVTAPPKENLSPLDIQVQQLLATLRAQKETPFLLIGDFNLPTYAVPQRYRVFDFAINTVFGQKLSSYWYRKLSSLFQDPFKTHPDTIPTKLSSNFVKKLGFKVDQAFTNKLQTKSRLVLPLAGSDHYPIYTLTRPF